MDAHKILISAGGTGGHLFSAQALAEEMENAELTPLLIHDNRVTQLLAGPFTKSDNLVMSMPSLSHSSVSVSYTHLTLPTTPYV